MKKISKKILLTMRSFQIKYHLCNIISIFDECIFFGDERNILKLQPFHPAYEVKQRSLKRGHMKNVILLIGFILLSGLVYAQTGWQATTISGNCQGDVIRPMATGVYDLKANKTYITYIGPNASIYASECDHNNGNTWKKNIFVAVNPTTMSAKYSYPQIVQTNDGYIHIFFVKHTTNLFHVRSSYPNDGTKWDAVEELLIPSPEYTKIKPSYPHVLLSRNGNVYLFWRQFVSDNTRPEFYSFSKDNGKTWENARAGLRPIREDLMNEIYMGQMTIEPRKEGQPERFHMAYILAGGEGHNDAHKDIYHTIFQPNDGNFYGMDGANLGVEVDATEMYAHCLVEDTGAPYKLYPGYGQSVGMTYDGKPIISGRFIWNGTKFVPYTPTGLNLADGIAFMEWENGRLVAYGDRVEVYTSKDGGYNWTQEGRASLPLYNSGRSNKTVPINYPAHPAAKLWSKESSTDTNCYISVVSCAAINKAQKILMTSTQPSVGKNSTTTIRAYVTDSLNARQLSATNTITFQVVGSGTLSRTTVTAVNGVAEVTYTSTSTTGKMYVRASGAGLKGESIDIYVDGSIEGSVTTDVDTPTASSTSGLIEKNSFTAYPNPFRATSTTIAYQLNNNAAVSYEIYDITGRQVYTSESRELPEGNYSQQISEIERAGLYIIRLKADNEVANIKVQKL